MKVFRTVGLSVLLCLLPYHEAASAPQQSTKPVALIYALTGEATLTVPGGGRQPLRLFDRLSVGTALEVGTSSRLAIAFANGRRYELGERSRATLGQSDLASRSGPVRPLPRVPPLPRILPIAEEEHPGPRPGAPLIRAERITGLYPRDGAATLAAATTLRFEPVNGAGKYRIEVQDRQGNVVFATETTASSVGLSPKALQPGKRYDWTVRTIDRVGPVAQGEAGFVTLPARVAEEREALRKAVERLGDKELLALLAEVDRSLGLLDEMETGVLIEEVTPESLGSGRAFRPAISSFPGVGRKTRRNTVSPKGNSNLLLISRRWISSRRRGAE